MSYQLFAYVVQNFTKIFFYTWDERGKTCLWQFKIYTLLGKST